MRPQEERAAPVGYKNVAQPDSKLPPSTSCFWKNASRVWSDAAAYMPFSASRFWMALFQSCSPLLADFNFLHHLYDTFRINCYCVFFLSVFFLICSSMSNTSSWSKKMFHLIRFFFCFRRYATLSNLTLWLPIMVAWLYFKCRIKNDHVENVSL